MRNMNEIMMLTDDNTKTMIINLDKFSEIMNTAHAYDVFYYYKDEDTGKWFNGLIDEPVSKQEMIYDIKFNVNMKRADMIRFINYHTDYYGHKEFYDEHINLPHGYSMKFI